MTEKAECLQNPWNCRICGGKLRKRYGKCEDCEDTKNRAPLLAMEVQREKAVEDMKASIISIQIGKDQMSSWAVNKVAEKLIELGWRKL